MSEATTDERCGPNLPEQPVKRFCVGLMVLRQKCVEFSCQVQKDRAALEDSSRLRRRAVQESGNLCVRVKLNKSRAELIALKNIDEPGIVLSAPMAKCKQFFQEDGDLYAVRCSLRIQLKWMDAHGQFFFKPGASSRAIDVLKLATVTRFPRPDFWNFVTTGEILSWIFSSHDYLLYVDKN